MALSCGMGTQPIEGSLPLYASLYSTNIHQSITHWLPPITHGHHLDLLNKRNKEALRFFRFSPFKTAARTKATIAKTNCGSALEKKIKK